MNKSFGEEDHGATLVGERCPQVNGRGLGEDEVMKTKICRALTAIWVIVLCAGASFAVDDLDITFEDNGVVQEGDNYDDVFVNGYAIVVDVTGGTIGKLWSRDKSIVNITGGRITYAESCEQGTINISGGIVTEPSIWAPGGTINIRGGKCWNVEVGRGKLNLFGGQIAGMGISVPVPGGTVHVYGYDLAFYPSPGINDGRLKGFWQDGTPFSIDFLRGAYQAVVLHEIPRYSAPVANAGEDRTALATVGTIAEVTLDGSASSDPDLDELVYEWTWTISGQTYSATGTNPTIMLPVGIHTIELIVNDGAADSRADQVVITVQTLTQQIHAIRTDKLRLVEEIDAMLQKERQVAETLTKMLTTGDYGNLSRDDILGARETVYSSIEHNALSIKALRLSIERLQDTLLLLGSPVKTAN